MKSIDPVDAVLAVVLITQIFSIAVGLMLIYTLVL